MVLILIAIHFAEDVHRMHVVQLLRYGVPHHTLLVIGLDYLVSHVTPMTKVIITLR